MAAGSRFNCLRACHCSIKHFSCHKENISGKRERLDVTGGDERRPMPVLTRPARLRAGGRARPSRAHALPHRRSARPHASARATTRHPLVLRPPAREAFRPSRPARQERVLLATPSDASHARRLASVPPQAAGAASPLSTKRSGRAKQTKPPLSACADFDLTTQSHRFRVVRVDLHGAARVGERHRAVALLEEDATQKDVRVD